MPAGNIWLPSAARSATITSPDLSMQGHLWGLIVHLDVTAVSSLSMTLTVSMKDPASGVYEAIGTLGQTAVIAASHVVYQVASLAGAAVAPAANTNLLAWALLTEQFRLVATIGAGSGTFSVGYTLV